MSLRYPFIQKRSEDLKGAADRIKIWTREALSLSDDAAVTVSEINCRDPRLPWRGNSDPRNDPRTADSNDPHRLSLGRGSPRRS